MTSPPPPYFLYCMIIWMGAMITFGLLIWGEWRREETRIGVKQTVFRLVIRIVTLSLVVWGITQILFEIGFANSLQISIVRIKIMQWGIPGLLLDAVTMFYTKLKMARLLEHDSFRELGDFVRVNMVIDFCGILFTGCTVFFAISDLINYASTMHIEFIWWIFM